MIEQAIEQQTCTCRISINGICNLSGDPWFQLNVSDGTVHLTDAEAEHFPHYKRMYERPDGYCLSSDSGLELALAWNVVSLGRHGHPRSIQAIGLAEVTA